MCEDSTKQINYEKLLELLEVSAFDMLFTDPPYNINYKGRGRNTSRGIANDHM